MTRAALLRRRLRNHSLTDSACRTPLDVVRRMGAVQAQDYAAAKWAIALRAPGLSESDIDAALDAGTIIRTHVLRPTWHFVDPADLRWMLALTAPRIRTSTGSYHRRFELEPSTFARSRRVIERAFAGRRDLTRAELVDALRRAHLPVDGLRPIFLILDAEVEGLLCSGPRRGKQFTYALVDERVPNGHAVERDDALGRLARIYFTSHGPATLRDFAWWSGLTARDARTAIAAIAPPLAREVVDGLTCWFVDGGAPAISRSPMVHLLPNFDEYLVAYQDRGPITNGMPSRLPLSRGDLLSARLVINGIVAGTWKRTIGRRGVDVQIAAPPRVGDRVRRAMRTAAEAYREFARTS
jgi:hypothetical protein